MKFFPWVICVLLMNSCASSVSHLQNINDEPMLVGLVDKQELFKNFPAFKKNYNVYQPGDSTIHTLASESRIFEIEIFFGSWCGDSKRNLPIFLKILDKAKNPYFTYRLHALDRTKKDHEGLTQKFEIKRVPTMIFLENQKEIGRFTEHPVVTIEEDVLNILKHSRE